ncbi:MAG: hypothetical protein GY795_28590 [Desulfobacterales bacterium]|nr:hypothetical protein [Desulfobacterales bacterium]
MKNKYAFQYKTILLISSAFVFLFPVSSMGFASGIETCTPPVEPVTLSNPTIITACTETAIQTALDNGGHITFDCGQTTIPITSELQFSTATDTVLDGGGLITLDGQESTRIFHKGWHDPANTVSITIQNIRIINGKAPSGGSTEDHSNGAVNVGHPGTRLHIINSTFSNNRTTDVNTADNQGGAIYVANSYETVISGSEFIGNQAGNGDAFGGIPTGLPVFPTPAAILSPSPDSALTSASVTFTWSDAGAELYWLRIGTSGTGSNNVYSDNQSTNNAKLILSLPSSGETLYVRLMSKFNGEWLYNDYTYTAHTVTAAVMQNPTLGSALNSSTATFAWSDANAEHYWLWIGTSGTGSNNVYSDGQRTNNSKLIPSLPNNGETLYVRLWSQANGAWLYNDYTYIAVRP